ncbi:MAG: hypothetical protein F4Y53_00375 [Proteobacteria bacterium]|nr:hypothetical protein [Pseudomonadota bacterium]
MVNFKPLPCLMAAAILVLAQAVGAVGLPDVPNTHHNPHHKMTPNHTHMGQALTNGRFDFWSRVRFESVEDDFPSGHPLADTNKADMIVLRNALGYTTGRFHGFYARIEGEVNDVLNSDRALNLDGDFTTPQFRGETPFGAKLPGAPAGLKPPAFGPPPHIPAINRHAEGYAIIPDNDFEEINEAYIGWRAPTGGCPSAPGPCDGPLSFKLGRQTIIYDNHRWVGDVIWRGNNVAMDAFRVDKTLGKLGISYAYLDKVKRLFGPDSAFDEWKMDDSHLINISYKLPQFNGKIVAYGYLLDFDNNPRTPFVEGTGRAPPFIGPVIFDSETFGVRFKGRHEISDRLDIQSELEWANQDPTDDAKHLDDNDYYNIEFGVRFGGTRVDNLGFMPIGEPTYQIRVGYEVLESNGTNALQTPLATVHAFNGWADKFVAAPGGSATPLGGIEDTSITLTVLGLFGNKIGKNKLVINYHDYSTDRSYMSGANRISDYGDEWGILWGKPFMGKFLFAIKYTDFKSEDGFSTDTEKFWTLLQYRFK